MSNTPRIVLSTTDLRVVEVTYGSLVIERRGLNAMKEESWTEERRISRDGIGETSDKMIHDLLVYGQRPSGVAQPMRVNTGWIPPGGAEPLPARSPYPCAGVDDQKECPGGCTRGGDGPPCGPRCKG